MSENKVTNYLLIGLILISSTMFIWTVNYINSINPTNIPMTISAFNA